MLQKKSHHFNGSFVVMFVVAALLSQSNIFWGTFFFFLEIQHEFDQILTQVINLFDSPLPEVYFVSYYFWS